MNFTTGLPIYLQIAERLSDEILAGTYAADERVPGVREYSALLEVNVNTTVKAYEALSRSGVIYAKRGMGYFVSADARYHILEDRRQHFRETAMPAFFKQMKQLGISAEEIGRAFEAYLQQES